MAVTQLPPTAPSSAAHQGTVRRQSAREPAARAYARSLPVVPVRARGLTIEAADGRRYLDCLSGAGSLVLGHHHPVVLEAIRAALDPGPAPGVITPVQDAFTDELFATLPRGLADTAHVRFCGPAHADAVEAAFHLVRTATGRTGLLAFTGSDHRAPGTRVTRLPYPQDYRCPFGVGGRLGAQLAARWAESLLDDACGGAGAPAGMVVEPVQGEGGVIPAPEDWLRRLRALTEARSVPLIADELQTGVGRTGRFWAVEHSGIEPDVMILSKGMGGSLPLAVIVHREGLDAGPPGDRAGVSRGNQLAMAAGAATLRHVRENGLAERAALLGERMLRHLRQLAREHDCVGDVRGLGLMIGVEFVDPDGDPAGRGEPPDAPPGPRPPAPALAAAVQQECLRRGLIVEPGGRHSCVVRLLPPLTITDEQAHAILDRFSDAVSAAARKHSRPATPSTPKEAGAASPA
ncbi:aminotransferase class III-fold pyridoxal phosphate-dependent enzyme [Streptomyces sp. NPDC046215]|uniref:Diaminobutyrate--2-oxoglutarate transaminase n=1 Tax=Streptomyces stramineus TaxID=173861 RepID=A0ABP3JT32_9ACTN